MNNKQEIENIRNRLAELQHQLNTLEENAKQEECGNTFPAMLPDDGGWFLGSGNFYPTDMGSGSAKSDNDQNVFPSQEIAEAYGDAFCVMLELRRCEGAGHYYEEYGEDHGYGWTINGVTIHDGKVDCFAKAYNEMFAFFPPFPTEELAQAAIDNVGKERIIAAMKLLANVKGE